SRSARQHPPPARVRTDRPARRVPPEPPNPAPQTSNRFRCSTWNIRWCLTSETKGPRTKDQGPRTKRPRAKRPRAKAHGATKGLEEADQSYGPVGTVHGPATPIERTLT